MIRESIHGHTFWIEAQGFEQSNDAVIAEHRIFQVLHNMDPDSSTFRYRLETIKECDEEVYHYWVHTELKKLFPDANGRGTVTVSVRERRDHSGEIDLPASIEDIRDDLDAIHTGLNAIRNDAEKVSNKINAIRRAASEALGIIYKAQETDPDLTMPGDGILVASLEFIVEQTKGTNT